MCDVAFEVNITLAPGKHSIVSTYGASPFANSNGCGLSLSLPTLPRESPAHSHRTRLAGLAGTGRKAKHTNISRQANFREFPAWQHVGFLSPSRDKWKMA